MYTVRITHHPADGKAGELRAALVEHSKASNAAGLAYNVTQLLYAKEPTFINSLRYENLAALEAYQNASDPARLARIAKINACVDRPDESALYENLGGRPLTGEVNYALHRRYYPAAGKAGELRKALEQRANTPSPGSVGKGLTTLVLGSAMAHFVLMTLFSSLEGFDQYLKAQPTDSAVQSFAAQVGSLSSASQTEMYRVLLRFPT